MARPGLSDTTASSNGEAGTGKLSDATAPSLEDPRTSATQPASTPASSPAGPNIPSRRSPLVADAGEMGIDNTVSAAQSPKPTPPAGRKTPADSLKGSGPADVPAITPTTSETQDDRLPVALRGKDVLGDYYENAAFPLATLFFGVLTLLAMFVGSGFCETIEWEAWNGTGTLLVHNGSLAVQNFTCDSAKPFNTWLSEAAHLKDFLELFQRQLNDSLVGREGEVSLRAAAILKKGVWLKIQLGLFLVLIIVLFRTSLAFFWVIQARKGGLLIHWSYRAVLWSGAGSTVVMVLWSGLEYYLSIGYELEAELCCLLGLVGWATQAMCERELRGEVKMWVVATTFGLLGVSLFLCLETVSLPGRRLREENARRVEERRGRGRRNAATGRTWAEVSTATEEPYSKGAKSPTSRNPRRSPDSTCTGTSIGDSFPDLAPRSLPHGFIPVPEVPSASGPATPLPPDPNPKPTPESVPTLPVQA